MDKHLEHYAQQVIDTILRRTIDIDITIHVVNPCNHIELTFSVMGE